MPTSPPDDEPRFVPPDLQPTPRVEPSVPAELPAAWTPAVRNAQLLHAAICVAGGGFLVLVLVLQSTGTTTGSAAVGPVAWLLPLVLGITAVIAVPVIRRVGVAAARAASATAVSRFQTTSILVAALLEGPLLLGVVMGLVSGSPEPLAVAAGLLIALLLQFPTTSRARKFLHG